MKRLRLFFVFLICFTAGEGFCGGSQNRYVTFTDELISYVNDSGGNIYDLQYYLSVPLTMKILDNAQMKEIKTSEKGRLIVYTPSNKESLEVYFSGRFKLEFGYNKENKTFDFISAIDTKKEYKDLFANEVDPKPRLLVYYKSNGFFNVSAVTGSQPPKKDDEAEKPGSDISQSFRQDDDAEKQNNQSTPSNIDNQLAELLKAAGTKNDQLTDQLLAVTNAGTDWLAEALDAINAKNDRLNEELLATAKAEADRLREDLQTVKTDNDRLRDELLAAAKTEADRQTEDPGKVPDTSTKPAESGQSSDQKSTPTTPSRNIVAPGFLTNKDKIVLYIMENNKNASVGDVRTLVNTYFAEAELEGINHDIAIAQMCYATDYLRNQQFLKANNYAGFDAINRVPVTYRNMTEGVRAHIQHLKYYASGKLQGINANIDQRYNVLLTNGYLGKAEKIDDLFQYWAAPNRAQNYANGINNILNGLYLFAGS